MKSSHQVVVEVTLTLNQEEVEWLRGLVQNPLDQNESLRDARLRESLFKALTLPAIPRPPL